MREYNKYVRKWQDLAIKMNEAMQKDNFELADRLMNESNEVYAKYKECCSYPGGNRSMSFGELNSMLESELPRLFKKDKACLRECTKLMKEDINLRSAFRFIDALRRYNCNGEPKGYVKESLELVSEGIDRKTFKKSLNKLADMLSKHEIGKSSIDEDTRAYYRACDKVLLEKKSLSNLTEYVTSIDTISSYIESHKAAVNESVKSFETISEELEKKIANLTEEEQSLVKDIIDFKAPMVEERKEKLFNKFKNECIGMIDNLMESADENDKEGLSAIREQINNKTYCKETIVQDMAKLLEIRDVLSEK